MGGCTKRIDGEKKVPRIGWRGREAATDDVIEMARASVCEGVRRVESSHVLNEKMISIWTRETTQRTEKSNRYLPSEEGTNGQPYMSAYLQRRGNQPC